MTITKRWCLHPQHPDLSGKLAERLNCHPIIGQLLLNRGITSLSQARAFIDTSGTQSQSFDAEPLNTGIRLIQDAIKNNKRIVVYGDYDVDGMTSTAAMVTGLRAAGANPTYIVPNRFTDGYGLNLNTLSRHPKPDLLITLDCGISNAKEIAHLRKQGSDVIIMDHHVAPEKGPDASVILNPKDLDASHACESLCTVGIVYKFLEAFVPKAAPDMDLTDILDLVALGTIADIAKLKGENRRLTKLGLAQLGARRRLGIRALLAAADFRGTSISARDVGFMIAPRLNASGRLASAELGVNTLLADSHDRAAQLAQELQTMNEKRRHIGQEMLQESEDMLAKEEDHNSIVLSGFKWHQGVIGITAARLGDKYTKPVVMIACDEHEGRGSARSVGNVNIYALLASCKHYFTAFGGHKEAAGFSIKTSDIPAFKAEFLAKSNALLSEEHRRPLLHADMQLEPEMVTMELAEALHTLEPFGQGNPQPVFYANTFNVVEYRAVGNGSHLKLRLTSNRSNTVIDAIGFGLAHKMECCVQTHVELLFHIDINEWQGRRNVQLQLLDIK